MRSRESYERVFMGAIKIIQSIAPRDTGNLALNSVKGRWISPSEYEIYVDVGDMGNAKNKTTGVAPYMPYTTEKWVSPRWNGKQNPNEGWWDYAVKLASEYIAKRLGGKVDNKSAILKTETVIPKSSLKGVK